MFSFRFMVYGLWFIVLTNSDDLKNHTFLKTRDLCVKVGGKMDTKIDKPVYRPKMTFTLICM